MCNIKQTHLMAYLTCFANTLLWNLQFLLTKSEIDLWLSFPCFLKFWHRNITGFIKYIEDVACFSVVWSSLDNTGIFDYLIKTTWAEYFLSGKLLNYWFDLLNFYNTFQLLHRYLSQFWLKKYQIHRTVWMPLLCPSF